MLDDEDLELLGRSQQDHAFRVQITVNGCAYSCCGKGWRRIDGYEQRYRGWIDNLDEQAGTFMLYSAGLGTISYVVAVRFSEVLLVEPI